MQGGRCATFDPAVLDAFFRIEDEIKAIAERYRDEEPEPKTEAGAAPAPATDTVALRAVPMAVAERSSQ